MPDYYIVFLLPVCFDKTASQLIRMCYHCLLIYISMCYYWYI